MSPKNKTPEPLHTTGTVAGLFRRVSQAERAISDLKDAGFSGRQIGVLMQDRTKEHDLAKATGTKAGEGAAAGAVSGGVLGGIVGLLAGVGALAIPGVGPFVAGGALASTLAGAGVGAAAGGLVGALIGAGIPEEEARFYERGLQEGGVLVTVYAGDRAAEARQILRAAGAEAYPLESERGARIELREEELRATTEPVKAGEVRVRKEVVTEEKAIDVPVTREEVVIERHPPTGAPVSGTIKEDEEIRIPLTEEQVRVEKRPVVKEEITVGKRKVQETETVRDTVRREEARIEESGAARMREPWRGKERRRRRDRSYTGPERRVSGV